MSPGTFSLVILRSEATKDLLLATAFMKADPSLRSGWQRADPRVAQDDSCRSFAGLDDDI